MGAPLWEALCRAAASVGSGFHTPGHNGGTGLPEPLKYWRNWGALDLSELEGLDNLHAPVGVIAQAQQLAAEAWGAERSWFLINGSTVGIAAMLLATVGEGDTVLLPRNCHQSVLHALVLCGAKPVYLEASWDSTWELSHGPTLESVEVSLASYPEARAVLVVHPTYFGATGEVAAIARAVHAQGIPLLVDAAHGAHFRFHEALPVCALAAGADVVVHSAHKTLPALTQAALLHQQGSLVDPGRIEAALRLLQSTSPSYLLMASLDLARAQMVNSGHTLLAGALVLAEKLRAHLPFAVLAMEPDRPVPGLAALDPTRITIDVAGCGWSGFAAEAWLNQEAGVRAELATHRHLVFILNTAHGLLDIEKLRSALFALAAEPAPAGALLSCPVPRLRPGEQRLTPRQAFERPHRRLPLAQAIGCTSAAAVSAYPPGVPIVLPGEAISAEAVDYLLALTAAGGEIVGLDPQGRLALCLD